MSLDTKRKHYIIIAGLLVFTGILLSITYHIIERKWVHFRKAENLFLSGHFESAIPYYRSALDLGLDRESVYMHLGGAYLAVDRPEPAKEIFEKLIISHPDTGYVFLELLRLYDRLGYVDEALELYHSHRDRRPGDPEVSVLAAALYQRKGDSDAAEALYLEALEHDPASVPARLGLAGILASRRQYREAIGMVKDILEENPSDRTARIYLARFMSWSGDMEGAIEEYRKVVP